MKMLPLPSAKELMRLFQYDGNSGELLWRERSDRSRSWNIRFAGKAAGSPNSKGAIQITIGARRYYSYRIIWKIHHGSDPVHTIDHRDGDKKNNKIQNLRLATPSQQAMNRRNWGAYPKGVTFDKGRYVAKIRLDGSIRTLGSFDTPEQAHTAYAQEATRLFGEFACLDR